jgi:Putative Se/S carrier protein-like
MTLPRLKEKAATKGHRVLALFKNIADALMVGETLREEGYAFKLVTPPPKLRKGCGLALEINLVEQPGIERLLKQKEASITPLDPDISKSLENVRLTDFGDWLMIKVGSMKLTYHKQSEIIVNISGSGCSDVPYLYAEMVDKPLTGVSRPRDIGFSPCALLLDQALQKALDLCKGDN